MEQQNFNNEQRYCGGDISEKNRNINKCVLYTFYDIRDFFSY